MTTHDIVAEIDSQIARLQQARSLLSGVAIPKRRGRPLGSKVKHKLSPEGRRAISVAMKKRWAAKKAANK